MKTNVTDKQIEMIFAVYRHVCAQREIDPLSDKGREIATRMFAMFDGSQNVEQMKRKFLH
ncbi:hypothetical protein [Neorhizobium alkalisoli]|uniref:hypothetical protein n=1 Tax=Neorhizobium alkalisoli TaxID=528178 RepID=UPI0011A97D0B|nr:hypothetical protein [Neorhizobium alkalisoli]